MTEQVRISKDHKNLIGNIKLTCSKSESNRALIIQALCKQPFEIKNLSNSDDSRTMQYILREHEKTIFDVGNAGTVMRFLTAFFSIQENRKIVLTGSKRMKERPLYPLINALRELGAEILCVEKEGFPPIEIKGKKLKGNEITIDAGISSQYITALMMIAPLLENGLKINLNGKLASRPYLEMTLKIMSYFGIEHIWGDGFIQILKGDYKPKSFTVEGDWSSASYLYALAIFSKQLDLNVIGLRKESFQGDSVIADLSQKYFGVNTEYLDNSISLTKKGNICESFEYDFSDCPDIAQTVAVICAGLGIKAKLYGLESLKIKETDRIIALANELTKIGVNVYYTDDSLFISSSNKLDTSNKLINTYDDHRMALSFSTLAMLDYEINIENPKVVSKSYPNYFDDLSSLGFKINI
jgi:3-phosphoshikimate 1-carboxyvinyltransferase